MAEVFVAKQVGIGGFEKVVALKRILLADRSAGFTATDDRGRRGTSTFGGEPPIG